MFELPIIRGKYRPHYSLHNMSWFGVGGKADMVFIPEDLEDLQYFLQNKHKDIPITIMGVGSNLLIRDGGISGCVIRLGRGFNYICHDDSASVIHSGAAVLSLNLALYCKEHSLQGLEFLAGIPGTIGGGLAMNAGAYNCDISQILVEAKAINIQTGALRIFTVDEIQYKYRGKILSDEWLFVEGVFAYTFGEQSAIAQKIKDIQEQRISTQPIKSKTGGSTFKNPQGMKAWQLIHDAGCRGLKIGGAQMSEQHCNFIINTGDASASDIEQLMIAVQERVLQDSGIQLELEIKIIGQK